MRIIFLFVFIFINFSFSSNYFPVIDGKKQAIFVGKSLFLRKAIYKCTGKLLKQIPEKDYKYQKGDFPIFVGETEKARSVLKNDIKNLDVEGYIFLVKPDFLIIYAKKPATDTGDPRLYAEANFARKFLKVDFYFPGSLGAEFPKLKKILIPSGKYVENPVFKHRHWSGYCGKAGPTWRIRASGGGGRFKFHHNLYRIIAPEKYKNHPEYFPVISEKLKNKPVYKNLNKDERYIPPAKRKYAYWQPCISNPDVVKITINTICNYFKNHPDEKSFSIGINDCGGFCQCKNCLKIYPDGFSPSSREANAYRFYRFYNKVAEKVSEKYPDVRLGFLVYSDLSSWIPEKLSPVLMPYITLSFSNCFDREYKKQLYKKLKKWAFVAKHKGIYEYMYGKGFLIPRIYLKELSEGLQYAKNLGFDGFYAEAYPNWGLDGPKLWIVEKLLWNPEKNVDKLLNQWCNGLFGEKTGKHIKNYFLFLENCWTNQKYSEIRGSYRLMGSQYKEEQFKDIFPPEICDKAWALIERAEKEANKTGCDEKIKRRIKFFKESFGATRIASYRFNASENLNKLYEEELKSKKDVPFQVWIKQLENWAKFPSVEEYIKKLKKEFPFAFYEFCEETYSGRKTSFAKWDSFPESNQYFLNKIMNKLLKSKKWDKFPESKKEFERRMEILFENYSQNYPYATTFLKNRLSESILELKNLKEKPVIDGEIEEIWGKPQFFGNFYLYPYEDLKSGPLTKIWFGVYNKKFYVAFKCFQDFKNSTLSIRQRDKVMTKENNIVLLDEPIPYFLTNSAGIELFSIYKISVVTSEGGIFDATGTPYGYSIEWNGTVAKTKKYKDYWSAEIEIKIGEKDFDKIMENPLKVNFIRCLDKKRYSWIPAKPGWWSISTRTYGIGLIRKNLFFQH